jgi:hypothetical protein
MTHFPWAKLIVHFSPLSIPARLNMFSLGTVMLSLFAPYKLCWHNSTVRIDLYSFPEEKHEDAQARAAHR